MFLSAGSAYVLTESANTKDNPTRQKLETRFIEKFLENQSPNFFNLALPAAKYLITNAVNPTRLFFLTLVAMIAFASNSLLCRAALKETGIDAASFTLIRILSGAVALWVIITMRKRTSSVAAVYDRRTHGNWVSGLALFAYAATFSFAYNTLSAGTGALLLFGAVQATMILWGFCKGERLRAIQVIG